jgi:hypothetical protein
MEERKIIYIYMDIDRQGWNVGLPDDILAESSDGARVQVLVHVLRGRNHTYQQSDSSSCKQDNIDPCQTSQLADARVADCL